MKGGMSSPSLQTPAPETSPLSPINLSEPRLYLDRELSLLAFQRRVLEEARDPENPLLERVKFLSILSSNLDEFFMVRVAVLRQKAASNIRDGVLAEQLARIRAEVRDLVAEAYETWRELDRELAAAGIEIRDYSKLTTRERAAMEAYFATSYFRC